MKRLLLVAIAAFGMSVSSCTMMNYGMKRQENYVHFDRTDLDLSAQFSAEGKSVKIFMIDWSRLFAPGHHPDGYFTKNGGVPIIGSPSADCASREALHKIIKDHPDYDFIIYPRYEEKVSGFWPFFSISTAKVTARLAKIK